jgi:hypothetical protein
MQKLSPLRFGVAIGAAGTLFYAACMVFMATVPMETVTWFSNSLLHGVDIKSIMRESVPLPQTIVGILSTFVGGLIFGSLSACLYNFGLKPKSSDAT